MQKLCSKCKQLLELECFYPSTSGRFGVSSLCRECESERHKSAYMQRTGKQKVATHKHTIEKCHEHAAKHGGKCLSTKYINADTQYQWECSCGHIWHTNLPTTTDRWCPKCASQIRKQTKAKKYGDPNFNNREKAKQTCLERFGAECSMQNADVARRNAKSRNNSVTVYHWLTGQEIVCQGSFEVKVVEKLNNEKTNYVWQVPFTLSTNKVYICDIFLPDINLFVEIKGRWFDDAKEKFELWRKEFPDLNVQIWDRPFLRTIGIQT